MNFTLPVYLMNVALHAVALSALATTALVLTRRLPNRTAVAIAGLLAAGVLPWITALRPVEKAVSTAVVPMEAPKEILPTWTVMKMRAPEVTLAPVAARADVSSAMPRQVRKETSLPDWPTMAVVAWAAGSAGWLVFSGIAWMRVRNWRKGLVPVDEAAWEKIKGCGNEGVGREVFLIDEAMASPCVTGFLKPRIVLPRFLLEKDGMNELRWAARHEAGHLQSGDSRWTMVFCLIRGMQWWNPLAGRLISRWAEAREQACDLRAANDPENRADYGGFLVAMAGGITRRRPMTVTMARRGCARIRKRIQFLLDTKEVAELPMGGRRVVLACGLFAGLGVIVSGMKVGADEVAKNPAVSAELPVTGSGDREKPAEPKNLPKPKLSLGQIGISQSPENGEGKKVILTIPIEKGPEAAIDPSKVSIEVLLLNRTDKGEIVELKDSSRVKNQWLDLPADWADGVETLRVTYTTPPQDSDTYHGQKVVLRYEDEVVDTQAFPKVDPTPATVAPVATDDLPAGENTQHVQIKFTTRFVVIPAEGEPVADVKMALKDVLDGVEVQALLKVLSQKRDTHLTTAPSVTARDGQKAIVEIVWTAEKREKVIDGKYSSGVPFVGVVLEVTPQIEGKQVMLKTSLDYRYIPGEYEFLEDGKNLPTGPLPDGTDLSKIKSLGGESIVTLTSGQTQWTELGKKEGKKTLWMLTTVDAIDATGALLDSFMDGKRIENDPRRQGDFPGLQSRPDPAVRGKLRVTGHLVELAIPEKGKEEGADLPRLSPCDAMVAQAVLKTPGARVRKLKTTEIPLMEREVPWVEFPELKLSAIASEDYKTILLANWQDKGSGEFPDTWDNRPNGSFMTLGLSGKSKAVNKFLLFRIDAVK